jgi:very-short-patch-repair endonuclease
MAKLTPAARKLRKTMTLAEVLLWNQLKARQFHNLKFRKQSVIGPYIADFLCHENKLIIEVDGGQHGDMPSDAVRASFLESKGFQVLRFWNEEILNNLDGVLKVIEEQLNLKS